MARILIAEDEPRIRELLVDTLFDAGYDVIHAGDGGNALRKAIEEQPDAILLDVMMPVMDGFEVMKSLKENPSTQDIPVILLTALDAAQGEKAAMDLGVAHYITKPLEPGIVEAAVKNVLRQVSSVNAPVRIGQELLDLKLAGGIPLASLALIEGTSSAGKSVLCQHFMSTALRDGHRVVCFTSENSARSLVNQMGSLGMDVSREVRADKFRIFPMEEPPMGVDPSESMAELALEIGRVPRQYKIICVDAITNLASACEDPAIVSFFASCKRLAAGGKVILLVAHSFAFDEKMLTRLRSVCDAHLNLRVVTEGSKQMRVLEVHKIQNSEGTSGNVVYFTVEPNWGLKMNPFSRT